MAERLNPNDTQRLVRAREIIDATGKSLAYWQSLPVEPPPAHYVFKLILVSPERDILYDRCNARFDVMMKNGALDEVKNFDRAIADGKIPADAPLTHALGFRPLLAALHGQMPMDEALEKAKAETRQYAKRQVTWFRHQLTPSNQT